MLNIPTYLLPTLYIDSLHVISQYKKKKIIIRINKLYVMLIIIVIVIIIYLRTYLSQHLRICIIRRDVGML